MLRRVWITGSAGIGVGALAGLVTALSDFGAHWLFLESTDDRLALLVRLVCLQPVVGAILGCLAGVWLSVASAARLPSTSFRFAALCALPLVGPCAWVARLLFTGGTMSRLPGQWLWIAAAFAGLSGLAVVACWFAARVSERARNARWSGVLRTAGVLAGSGFALGKLNQHVLPNLYDYLHAVLSAAAWAAYALALALVGRRLAQWRQLRASAVLAAGAPALALLLAAGTFGLNALDDNQNVRVALLHPNMPSSRSLLLGAAPLLPKVDRQSAELAKRRAQAARRSRAARSRNGDLPTSEDAHVLLITVDALRGDRLGVAGYARDLTPELDGLARRGVLFERAYAQAPHSSYSLCSLMTSEYLHETLDLGLPPPEVTLPSVLAQSGYHGAAFYTQGIFHTAGERLRRYRDSAFGFALHEHSDRPAEEMTDRVLSEVDRTVTRGEPSSLFWVHYFDVHEPYEATTLGTSDVDRYDSEILATDRALGRLVREVEARLAKPVIVVVTADHGEEFHEHGGVYHGSSLYDEQIRVPLILVAPPLPAARVRAPVELIDIAPTLLGLLGLEVPESMRGRDLRALALGRDPDPGPVFSAVIHKRMVVRWPHKLIADLRFGFFELYDLEQDPRERDNRAGREPERVESLRGEIYAWLDSLGPRQDMASNSTTQALEWGRLGDRRAVEPLSALVLDEAADRDARREAARLLGSLADPRAIEPLVKATHLEQRWVAAEAAIALGRLFEPRAGPPLRQLIAAEDPDLRSRAAVSLGRLRDPAAVPALIDALWVAPNAYERQEAVRWLGRLGDPSALPALLNLIPDAQLRHLVVVALGELRDPRAYAPLLEILTWDRNATVRDGVARALATLGQPQAIDVVVGLATDEPALVNPGEALVRLGAAEQGRIGGADMLRQGSDLQGFGRCRAGPLRHDWDFRHRTVCRTAASRASFRIQVPPEVAASPHGVEVLLSVRRVDAVQPAEVELRIGEHALPTLRVDGAWQEARWSVPAGALGSGRLRAWLRAVAPEVRLEVDHLLIVPRDRARAAHATPPSPLSDAPRPG